MLFLLFSKIVSEYLLHQQLFIGLHMFSACVCHVFMKEQVNEWSAETKTKRQLKAHKKQTHTHKNNRKKQRKIKNKTKNLPHLSVVIFTIQTI